MLHGEVPCKRLEDGSRGEEMWLWDYSLGAMDVCGGKWETSEGEGGLKYGYSVLAPLRIINKGRREVLEMVRGEERGKGRRPAGVV